MTKVRMKWLPTVVWWVALLTVGLGACPGARPVAERPAAQDNPVQALSAQLKDADSQRRAKAARKLGATRHAHAVAPLSAAIADPKERVRLAVVDACGVHGSPKLIPALKKALEDRSRLVRRRAVRALAKIGTREAAEAMIGCLDGASMWLRPTVADGLMAMPPTGIAEYQMAVDVLVAELDPSRPKRLRRLARALARLGDAALDTLLREVDKPRITGEERKHLGPDGDCRRGSCRALVSLGSAGIPRLMARARDGIQGLDSGSLYRIILPLVFGRMGKPAIAKLLPLLGGRGSPARMAEKALVTMGGLAVKPLLRILTNPRQALKRKETAVKLLGRIRDRQAFDGLMVALKNRRPLIAAAAARALASKWSKLSLSPLTALLGTGPRSVRMAIVMGARHVRGPLVDQLLLRGMVQTELEVKLRAIQALGRRKVNKGVPALLAALKNSNPKVRLAAVKALGRIGDQRATRPLLRLVRGRAGQSYLRVALRALGRLKDPKTYRVLARHARRGKKALRLVAIGALGDLGTKRAKKLLGRLKKSKDQAIAQAATGALKPASAGGIGLPECDRYFRVMLCYLKKMPAAAQAPAMAAFQKSIVAWKKMAKGPARASLAKTCKMTLKLWSKSMRKISRYRSCFVP